MSNASNLPPPVWDFRKVTCSFAGDPVEGFSGDDAAIEFAWADEERTKEEAGVDGGTAVVINRNNLVLVTIRLLPGYPAVERLRLRYEQFRRDRQKQVFLYQNTSVSPAERLQMSYAWVKQFPLASAGAAAGTREIVIAGQLDEAA